MLVGKGAVGKTTLLRRLQGGEKNQSKLRQDVRITDGLDIALKTLNFDDI